MQCCLKMVAATACVAALAGTIALAQPAAEKKSPPAMPEMQLPPGMTPEMMQACMEASIPGEMHAHMASDAGKWIGAMRMWMAPGTDPVSSECVTNVTPMMDGRFVKIETSGDMPGMGPFLGFGLAGFDNVTRQFQMTWIDNCGTGMMVGTGELSSDRKTMTWNLTYNCPVSKSAKKYRQVERFTGPNTKTMEMHMPDFATGKEFKMLEIAYTRAPDAPSATVPTNTGR